MKREKEHIKLVDLILKIWKKDPNLRLFQLLGNPFSPDNHYYIEDSTLIEKLKEYYKVE